MLEFLCDPRVPLWLIRSLTYAGRAVALFQADLNNALRCASASERTS